MPDINPAALSHPSPITTTPILPPKTLSAPPLPKVSKTNNIPPRIDLESFYTALKSAIGESWTLYKESISLFVLGQLNQVELSTRIDGFITSQSGDTEHLHNQLITAIFANVTREMPDVGVASWVSAHDKPTINAGSKPVTGDAAEQRLKTEVMQLPNRDRRRLKELTQNDSDPYDALANMLGEHRKSRPVKTPLHDALPSSASGLSKTNLELEIRKRYTHPLAAESGEFPDAITIESRMLPICYETGLIHGHVSDAAHFMSVATETFVKEVLSSIFSKTRSNGPGSIGSAGTGGGSNWIQTHKYRTLLGRDEEAWLRGEIQRDKNGLLPTEAKTASERRPLGMADVRTALEMGDCGLGQMPVVVQKIMLGYREGELEAWEDYTFPTEDGSLVAREGDKDIIMVNASDFANGVNEIDCLEFDNASLSGDDWGWEGLESQDISALDSLLDSCLAVGA